MLVETSRFGEIEVNEEDIITFPEGMLGFSKINKYVLIERDDDSLFLWLQALKRPTVAFPLLEPQLFEMKYQVELGDDDRKILDIDDLSDAKVFAIITIPSDPTKMTANLKAPIVMNVANRRARQVILMADYAIRQPVFADLQRYCATSSRTIFPREEDRPYHAIPISQERRLPATATR